MVCVLTFLGVVLAKVGTVFSCPTVSSQYFFQGRLVDVPVLLQRFFNKFGYVGEIYSMVEKKLHSHLVGSAKHRRVSSS
jgi:hypothetical protein